MSTIIAPEWSCEVIDRDVGNPNHYQPVWLDPDQAVLVKQLVDAAYQDWLREPGE